MLQFLFSVLETSQQRLKGYYSNSDFMLLTTLVKHTFRGSDPTSLHTGPCSSRSNWTQGSRAQTCDVRLWSSE